jgi:DNA-binding response OmpR family regulator
MSGRRIEWSCLMPMPHVLIADDDPLLRGLLEHRFTAAGYRVSGVEDGLQALKAINDDPPELLILDAMMPVMDGFETLRRIRADSALREVPVIMLTALRQEDAVMNALNLGAADYLSKPFIPDELLARARRVLPLSDVVTPNVDPSNASAGH